MSDPTNADQGASGRLLAYDAAREYRPNSRLAPKAAAITFAAGVACAVGSAGVMTAWYASGASVIIGLAGAVQGAVLGWLLARVVRRVKVRSVPAAAAICVLCAVLAVTLAYAALYVRQAYATYNEVRRKADSEPNDPASIAIKNFVERQGALTFYDNFVLARDGGRRGFVGFLTSHSMTRGGKPERPLVTYLINAAAAVFVGLKMVNAQVRRPFCDDCGAWFGEPANAAVLPAEYLGELTAVVEGGDPAAAIELNHRAAAAPLGGACAVAQTRKCSGCGAVFADVVVKHGGSDGRRTTRPVRVSPEFARALRSEPVAAIADAPPVQGDAERVTEG
jgi:hypothetical protein